MIDALRRPIVGLVLLFFFFVVPPSNPGRAEQAESPCHKVEDCFRSAVAKLRQGRVSNADVASVLERLAAIHADHPDSIWAKRAGLVTGLLLTERIPTDALPLLKAAQQDFPVLDEYLRLWTGEALLKTGDAAGAAALFESVADGRGTVLTLRAAFRAGDAWYVAGNCGKVSAWFERATAGLPQDPAAPPALFKWADCQKREGRSAEAQTILRQLWTKYPHTIEAREAEPRLRAPMNGTADGSATVTAWTPSPADYYGRAQAFLALSLLDEGAAALQKFLAMAPQDAKVGEVKLKLGVTLVRLKKYDQARPVLKDVAATNWPESGEAAVWLARTYLRAGEGEPLLALWQAANGRLTSEHKGAIGLIVGAWHEDQRQYEAALAVYRKVAQLNGGGSQRSDALWRIGWLQYRTGASREALATFDEMRWLRDDPQVLPKVWYWTARTAEQLREARADELYRELCRSYPYTYYCHLAQMRTDLGTVAVAPVVEPNGEADKLAFADDPHFAKAAELQTLGLDEDAAREWAWLAERYGTDRGALVQLAARLGQAGAYHQALRLVRLYYKDGLERGGDPVPPSLWPLAYPTALLPAIRHAGPRLVDPYLAAALIREESHYDARAVSRVGAIGLMQLMPATAQTVAKKDGNGDVTRDALFDVDTNVRLGVRYLGQLLDQFDGNLVYAVAAYNAGPQAVSAWVAKNGVREIDEFVEQIPYQETRQYVKRVLRSYREYRRLGGDGCTARVLDKVC